MSAAKSAAARYLEANPMTTWRDELLPASFRGVPFYVDSDSMPVGRRTQVHEYPQRDKPFVEDLGRKTRISKFAAFVVGDDCFFQRDNLLHALDQPGIGELVHPWFGRMNVTATDGCECSHERLEGGVVRFSLVFVEEGEKGFPAGVPNTSKQVEAANENFLDSAISRYKVAMALVNKARLSVTALKNGIAGIQMAIQREFSQITGLVGSVTDLADMLINAPDNFSAMISGMFSSMEADFDRFGSSQRDASSKVESARSLSAESVTASTSGGAATVALVAAARTLVRDALLIDAVRTVGAMPVLLAPPALPAVPTLEQQVLAPVARPEVPATADVLELRTALTTALWEAALVAPHEHFAHLEEVRKQISTHLAAVARSGIRLVSVTPKESIPAVVLAYQRFGDASRADEIVTRNKIIHPGFLPPTALQVALE
jgi:prophage DNA circulation protein